MVHGLFRVELVGAGGSQRKNARRCCAGEGETNHRLRLHLNRMGPEDFLRAVHVVTQGMVARAAIGLVAQQCVHHAALQHHDGRSARLRHG